MKRKSKCLVCFVTRQSCNVFPWFSTLRFFLSLKSEVSSGTILAVKADDNDYPYYLVRASKHPTVLRKTATDKSGYQGYTRLLLDTIDYNPLKLKLLKRVPAIVPALSIIYICSEIDIDDNGVVNLNESLHGRILRLD